MIMCRLTIVDKANAPLTGRLTKAIGEAKASSALDISNTLLEELQCSTGSELNELCRKQKAPRRRASETTALCRVSQWVAQKPCHFEPC